MTSTKLLVALVLVVPLVCAQRGGAGGGGIGRAAGPPTIHSSPMHSASVGVVTGRNRGRPRSGFAYGLGYGWPTWDYGAAEPDLWGGELGDNPEYSPEDNLVLLPPSLQRPAPAPKPAVPVMHEYNFGKSPPRTPIDRTAFTIVLKDGSSRAALASWVSADRLHYVDEQSRQHVLAPELIDRDATQRANEAKNLSMELPPG